MAPAFVLRVSAERCVAILWVVATRQNSCRIWSRNGRTTRQRRFGLLCRQRVVQFAISRHRQNQLRLPRESEATREKKFHRRLKQGREQDSESRPDILWFVNRLIPVPRHQLETLRLLTKTFRLARLTEFKSSSMETNCCCSIKTKRPWIDSRKQWIF